MAISQSFPTFPASFPTPLAGVHVGRRLQVLRAPSGALVLVDPFRYPPARESEPLVIVAEPAAVTSAGFRAVVRNRRFMSLWFAQIGSLLAANMALYALTLVAFANGGSSASVSLLFLCFLAPAVLLSAPAGVVVDRFDRRTILVVTNLVRAGAFTAVVVVGGQLPLSYLLIIIAATATTFFIPAEAAMIPRVVPQDQLMPANGLFTFTLQAAFAVGFAVLGPLLVNVSGPSVTIGVAAILYLVAAALCWPLPSARTARTEVRPSARAEFVEGLRVVRHDPRVRWPLALLGLTASLIGVVGVLGPQIAVTQLGLSEQEFVLLVLPMAGGLVLGVAMMGVLARKLSHRRLAEVGLSGLVIALALLAFLRPIAELLGPIPNAQLIIAMPVAAMMGAAYALVAVPAQTSLQEALPDAIRGRVFAVLNLLINAASALPIVLVGPAADALGVPMVVGACAVATVGMLVASLVATDPDRVAGSSMAPVPG